MNAANKWLTPRAKAIVDRCLRGDRLVKSCGGQIQFFLERSGARVGETDAAAAINSGWLTASEDGLFPGQSQTWMAAQPTAERNANDEARTS